MESVIDEFQFELESIFYFYLNTLELSRKKHNETYKHFDTLLKDLAKASKELVKRENLLRNPRLEIKNYNKNPNENTIHKISTLIAVEHSIPNGYHEQILAASIISEIYNLWEDKYRNLIAKSIGTNKDNIKNDFWGDMRNYRRSIVHNKKRALKELENCLILPKVKVGNLLELRDELVIQIFNESIKSLKDIRNE